MARREFYQILIKRTSKRSLLDRNDMIEGVTVSASSVYTYHKLWRIVNINILIKPL